MTYLKLDQKLTADDPFTGSSLHELFSGICGNRRTLPDAAWFPKVSSFVNLAHGWAYAAQETHEFAALIRREQKRRAALARGLEAIKAHPMQRMALSPMAEQKRLDRTIANVRALDIPVPPPPQKAADWAHWADTLRYMIDTAMLAANPGYPVGQAKGKTSQLIAAINQRAFGAKTTPVAVATHFQKAKPAKKS